MDVEPSELAMPEPNTIWLHTLPSELVELTLSFLDCDPPSIRIPRSRPTAELTSCSELPLKSLSLVSRAWRRLTLRCLFRHSQLYIRGVYHRKLDFIHATIRSLHYFVQFLETRSLGPHVDSFVLISEQNSERYEDSLSRTLKLGPFFWPLIFSHINPKDILICSPPETLGCLTGLRPFLYDFWAFEIPFQLLHLRQLRVDPPRRESPESARQTSRQHCLLSACPWTYIALNEGSFVQSYSAYEYWLLRPPSLVEDSRLSDGYYLACITRLSFTAFFPQRSHVGNMLVFVRNLKFLKTLRVQLLPHDGSLTSDGEDLVKMGKIDPNDLWREVGESYSSILRAVSSMSEGGHLTWFESGDWVRPGDGGQEDQRTIVMNKISEELPGWMMAGNGCWKRLRHIPPVTKDP